MSHSPNRVIFRSSWLFVARVARNTIRYPGPCRIRLSTTAEPNDICTMKKVFGLLRNIENFNCSREELIASVLIYVQEWEMSIIQCLCIRRGIVITCACFSRILTKKSLPGELSRPAPVGPMWATTLAMSSSPIFLLPLLTINQPNQLRRLLPSCPRPPNQPIRQIDHPAGFFSTAAFLCMFDRMGHDSSLLVEFENEHAAEFFRLLSQTRRVRQPLRKSVNLFPRSDATI